MGAIKKIGKFGVGGLIGSVLGVAGGMFLAPNSGSETQKIIRERIRTAKVAGVEAQASKERELIDRYRTGTSSRSALAEAETASKQKLETKLGVIRSEA